MALRKGYSFILLHVDIQFSQRHLLKETILSPLCVLGTLFEDLLTVNVCIYFLTLYFVPMIYVSLFLFPYHTVLVTMAL